MGDQNLGYELQMKFESAITESRVLGYHPNDFARMLGEYGAVGAAKKLIHNSGVPQSGFKALIKLGRADLTVESIILDKRFSSLFTNDELEVARWSLSNSNKV